VLCEASSAARTSLPPHVAISSIRIASRYAASNRELRYAQPAPPLVAHTDSKAPLCTALAIYIVSPFAIRRRQAKVLRQPGLQCRASRALFHQSPCNDTKHFFDALARRGTDFVARVPSDIESPEPHARPIRLRASNHLLVPRLQARCRHALSLRLARCINWCRSWCVCYGSVCCRGRV